MVCNENLERMRENRHAARFMDGGGGLFEGKVTGNGARDPQREDMPVARADFHTGDDLERIATILRTCPQTGFQTVVIGDAHDIEIETTRGIIEHFDGARSAVAGGGVHMQIGAPGERQGGLR